MPCATIWSGQHTNFWNLKKKRIVENATQE
jgi:hypothetical protein